MRLTIFITIIVTIFFAIVKIREFIESLLNRQLIELGKLTSKEGFTEDFNWCVEEDYSNEKYRIDEQILALNLENPNAKFLIRRVKSLVDERGRLKGELFKNFSSIEHSVNYVFYMNDLKVRKQEFLITVICCILLRAFCYNKCVKPLIINHAKTLIRKRKYLVTKDDYGNYISDTWNSELQYFYKKCIESELKKFLHLNMNQFQESVKRIFNTNLKLSYLEDKLNKESRSLLGEWFDFATYANKIITEEEIKNLDLISESKIIDRYKEVVDGYDYERFIKDLLLELGCDADLTKSSGDQGADIIAKIYNKTVCVQCKLYSTSSIGNSAVQEVLSAKNFYDCDVAIVISNAPFSRSAKELATKTGINLLHHEQLEDFIRSLAKVT